MYVHALISNLNYPNFFAWSQLGLDNRGCTIDDVREVAGGADCFEEGGKTSSRSEVELGEGSTWKTHLK